MLIPVHCIYNDSKTFYVNTVDTGSIKKNIKMNYIIRAVGIFYSFWKCDAVIYTGNLTYISFLHHSVRAVAL